MDWKSKKYWLTLALFVMTAVYVNLLRFSNISVQEKIDLNRLPMQINEWYARSVFLNERTQNVLNADKTVWRRFNNTAGQTIWLFVAYFKDQKYGAQIHSPKHCLPGSGWKILNKGEYNFRIDNSLYNDIRTNLLITTDGKSKEMMFYWFWTRSGTITSEIGLKMDLAKNALLRNPTDASLIRLNLKIVDNNAKKTIELASQFINDIFPHLLNILPFTK